MSEVNPNEERIGGYRLRRADNVLVLDERASHALFEVLRVLFGLAFMAPACLFVGAATLPGGLFGISPSPGANQMSTGSWLLVAAFFCVPVAMFVIGFYYAFARIRVVAKPDCLLIGNSWFGVFQRLETYSLTKESALEFGQARRGAFSGYAFPLIFTSAGEEVIELLCHFDRSVVSCLAEAISDKAGVLVRSSAPE